MGWRQAEEFAEAVAQGWLPLAKALEWHFTVNHYPPLPVEYVAVAEAAIAAANSGDWESQLDLPNTHEFEASTATVEEIVGAFHLESFLR